ncbi:hypothetical protein FOCG_17392 [Fusarium oxysporum f. sp. radicis-lycopersici 26381]|nr:hypothetical protein FOCG_17392 [Fusarium oxysporum f. sp. radicis-lycopersici 26381]
MDQMAVSLGEYQQAYTTAAFAIVQQLRHRRLVLCGNAIRAIPYLIDTNRVAYWPGSVDCNNICIKVSYESRSVYLLKIDSSGGAYDISYDAWNYLGFGKSASDSPQQGGGIAMIYEFVHASQCTNILDNGKLPLAAANPMNYVASCLSEPNSWVAQNYELYNISDPVCKRGVNEKCYLNLSISNQPECPSGLGAVGELNLTVENILYPSGKMVPAQ